jgi:hypothetical protein
MANPGYARAYRMRGFVILALGLAACGGPPLRPGPLDPGQTEAAPSMQTLPDPDVRDEAFSRRMRFGWQLAAESFVVPPPEPPRDRMAQDLQLWSEQVLSPWIERKVATVEAARRELDHAAEENHRQRIISGAIVGLMYEDVGMALRSIPPPAELDDEPEIRTIYRDILRSQARPFLEHARRAYQACAGNAARPPGMRHWRRYCAGREERLPDVSVDGPALPSGETQVEVIRE